MCLIVLYNFAPELAVATLLLASLAQSFVPTMGIMIAGTHIQPVLGKWKMKNLTQMKMLMQDIFSSVYVNVNRWIF